MTIITNDPYKAPVLTEESSVESKISKYSNLSNEELLRLQVYYLEKQDREFQKFKEIVLKRLIRLEKVITNVRR